MSVSWPVLPLVSGWVLVPSLCIWPMLTDFLGVLSLPSPGPALSRASLLSLDRKLKSRLYFSPIFFLNIFAAPAVSRAPAWGRCGGPGEGDSLWPRLLQHRMLSQTQRGGHCREDIWRINLWGSILRGNINFYSQIFIELRSFPLKCFISAQFSRSCHYRALKAQSVSNFRGDVCDI